MVELDTSNGIMLPMYDPDANLIFLSGKEDEDGMQVAHCEHDTV